jgi:hypothetical protein
MNEHSFIKAIHRYLSPEVFKWKIHDTFAGGVPDAMYGGPAGLLFVEYKYIKALPKRPSTLVKHSLSELQKKWLNAVVRNTAAAALVVGSDKGCLITLIRDGWSPTVTVEEFLKEAVPTKSAASWIEAICLLEEPHVQNTSRRNGC